MSAAGLQYIADRFGVDLNSVRVFYDFLTSGNSINNVSQNFSGQFSGYISGSQPQFWANSGYGTFSQHMVTVSGTQNLTLSDFSVFIWGNRQNNFRDNSLFSSIEAGISGISSGSHVYINPANKLVYVFNTCNGTQSYVSNFSVVSDFAVGISKSQTRVELYSYDYTNGIINSNSFPITKSSDYFPINKFDIGYAPRAPSPIDNQFFSGKLNGFMLLSGAMDNANASLAFSGFYTSKTIVTTPAVSGDICTGTFSLPVNTIQIIPAPPATGTYYKQGVLIFSRPISQALDDVLLDCAISGGYKMNQPTFFSPLSNSVTLNAYTYKNIALYFNGQRLASGKAILTGQFCGTGFLFPCDYDVFGNKAVVGVSGINSNDILMFDVKNDITYIPQAVISTGVNTFVVNTAYGLGYYANGIRTRNFTLSGSSITPQSDLSANARIVVDYFDSGSIKSNIVVDRNPYFVTGGFIAGTSMLYHNGQRLVLGIDYLEIGSGEYSSFLFKDVPSTEIFKTDSVDNTWNI